MPQALFDETYFHPTYRDLFWQMITERMNIYWRRLEGAPPPWSNDPIMRTEFITNVYRELDPGTVYLQERYLRDEDLPVEDKIFNVMVYRLLGSRLEFHERLPLWQHDAFDALAFSEECKSVEREIGLSPFSEAYRTAAYSDMGTKDKIVNVGLLMAEIANLIPTVVQELNNALTLEQAYRTIENIRGFGEFLAYQIMVDLLYPAPFDPILPFDQNTWAMAGPGARRGIWRLMKPGMKPASMLDVMMWLRDNQEAEFERLGLEFPYLADETIEGDPPIKISLCNIQSCLCEFYKYTRIWDGEQKQVRRYTYGEALVADLADCPSVITVAKPSEAVGVGEVVVGADLGPDLLDGSEDASLPSSARPAPVPGELLEHGVADLGDEQGLSTPQPPRDHSDRLVDAVVREPALGPLVVHHQQRLGATPQVEDFRADVVDAFLNRVAGLRLDRDVIHNLIAVVDNSARVGQGDVQAKDSRPIEIHVHV